MKNTLFILALTIAVHALIWEAQLGVNALLFSCAVMVGIAWLKPKLFSRQEVKYLLAGWCLSSFWVVWHNSLLSIFVFWIFGFVLLGYLQQIRVRFWVFGLLESIRALFGGWWITLRRLIDSSAERYAFLPSWRRVRLLLIPLLVVIPFYLIYSGANTALGAFNTQIGEWLASFWQFEFDWSRIIFFLLGWAVVLAFLGRRTGIAPLHRLVADWQFNLQRKRQKPPWLAKTLGLKQEYQSAVLTFTALNVLLLIINLLDLVFVWFSAQERTAAELSQYVHEGTWLLLFSIVLAMLVVLGFFRNNLNFLTGNKRLRQLAYLWLGQNAFLALSVGVRNLHYIQQYALAHGRITVFVFLVLVLFGLFTMYRKVSQVKTIFYLLQMNAAAVLVVLLLAASMNWDSMITRYNLHQQEPDTHYLTDQLKNNLIPLLQTAQNSTILAGPIRQPKLQRRGERLAAVWEQKDWRSWNRSEWRQYRAWQTYLGKQ
jgi:hypothetical protein